MPPASGNGSLLAMSAAPRVLPVGRGPRSSRRHGTVFARRVKRGTCSEKFPVSVGTSHGALTHHESMKDQNGVVLKLVSTTHGASLKLAASGIRLTLVR